MDSRASIKIPINKLSPAFIKDMQEKYGDAELEITINPMFSVSRLETNISSSPDDCK